MFCVYLLDWFELRKRRLCYGAKKKVNKQEHGKKNHLERVNKWQYTLFVFKEQIGHF